MPDISNISNQTFGPNRPRLFQYAYTSSSDLWLQSSVFAVIQIFGLTGNFLVVISVLSERRLQTNYYLTVLQLSFCDIGLLACSIIAWQILPWIWYNGIVLKNFGLICKFWLTGSTLFYTTGVYFMVMIGYLRHRSVVNPFKEKLSRKRVTFTIVLVYLTSVVLLAPKFVSLDAETHSNYSNLCSDTYLGIFLYDIYLHSQLALQFVLPIIFLSLLYAKLCFSLHKHSKNIRQSCNVTQRPDSVTKSRLAFALQQRNTKAIFTGIIIVVIFVISNLPLQVQQQMTFVNGVYDTKQALWVSAMLYIGSACLNPYVYALLDNAISASFKKRLKIMFCRLAGV